MKALIISDIHGSYRILSSIYELITKEKIGCVIFAGDLVDMGEPVSFAEEFLWLIERTQITLLWVPGNNDFGRVYHKLNAKIKSLEGKIIEFGGHKYTGVGGSPASWAGQYEGERSVDKKAIAGTIFVSHVPPPGLSNFQKFDQANPKSEILNPKQIPNQKTQISKSGLSNFEFRTSDLPRNMLSLADAPIVHICGHIHHTWGIGYLGSTKVIKLAGGYLGYCAIMDLDNLKVKFLNLFK